MDEVGSNDDELFSMDDLEKDLKKGRGARRLPWLVTGLVLGIAGTILVPRFLAPYLPAVFGPRGERLTGPVLAEERDGDRLLLTLQTEPGALIASFTERVAEIALLVEPGDTVSILVDDYDPFVADPDFEGVRKASAPPAGTTPGATPAAPADSTGPAGDGADTATGAADTTAGVATPAAADTLADSGEADASPGEAAPDSVASSADSGHF
ncbi:MAG: hypothetical protein R3195_16950 [Gemmatimonadota bacterium]|nr:hypothetical protein [Gemmatimonadota bacterium]